LIDPALVGEQEAQREWTCSDCGVEVRLMANLERRGLPDNWAESHNGPVCLHCRRELAADAALADAALGELTPSLKERARLRSISIVEFEVRRTPGRTNAQIANAVHSSIKAVEKARERLAASEGLV
jgi:hypothetical protein